MADMWRWQAQPGADGSARPANWWGCVPGGSSRLGRRCLRGASLRLFSRPLGARSAALSALDDRSFSAGVGGPSVHGSAPTIKLDSLDSFSMSDETPFNGGGLDCLLQLFKRAHFDLTYAFA